MDSIKILDKKLELLSGGWVWCQIDPTDAATESEFKRTMSLMGFNEFQSVLVDQDTAFVVARRAVA